MHNAIRLRRRYAAALVAALMSPLASSAQDVPPHLRDRGPGVATSMFGTYVRDGELLVYPFFEWYSDSNLEYKPNEFGFAGDTDYRGKYRASEGLLFLGYGITRNLAIELEAAVITAELREVAVRYVGHAGDVQGVRARRRRRADSVAFPGGDGQRPARALHVFRDRVSSPEDEEAHRHAARGNSSSGIGASPRIQLGDDDPSRGGREHGGRRQAKVRGG